jgi:hypothetical protein
MILFNQWSKKLKIALGTIYQKWKNFQINLRNWFHFKEENKVS